MDLPLRPCTQCGRCCTNPNFMLTLSATREDLDRWKQEGRYDILEWAEEFEGMGADLWFDPITGEEQEQCPFVVEVEENKYHCGIYNTRPEVCRDYPGRVTEWERDNCEMYIRSDV